MHCVITVGKKRKLFKSYFRKNAQCGKIMKKSKKTFEHKEFLNFWRTVRHLFHLTKVVSNEISNLEISFFFSFPAITLTGFFSSPAVHMLSTRSPLEWPRTHPKAFLTQPLTRWQYSSEENQTLCLTLYINYQASYSDCLSGVYRVEDIDDNKNFTNLHI